jgi:putative SOS response-associated peptidase YedK
MCTNYRPAARDVIREQLGMPPPIFEYRSEMWPGYMAPILAIPPANKDMRLAGAGDGWVEWREAMFGLVPHFAKDRKIARHTYNARSETVAVKNSYRLPWARRQFCLIPMCAFFEPNYESGKAVRWRIERVDQQVFTVAGIWESWAVRDEQGQASNARLQSFSMLTINADLHPLMTRFHAPGDEKRSLAVVPATGREQWLNCSDDAAARAFLVDLPAHEFQAHPEPLPARRPRATA